jgi:hypothetical protein
MISTALRHGLIPFTALLVLAAPAAHAGKVYIKSCADNRIRVCVFNKTDTTLTSPKHTYILHKGDTDTANCVGNRCRLRITDAKKGEDNCHGADTYTTKSKRYMTINWATKKDSQVFERKDGFQACTN